jgi:hypothetical protein
VATATADSRTITYATSALVTLTIEGPAPLVVELPTELLTPEAEIVWRAQPVGTAARETLAGGRERWRLVVRVRAYPPLVGAAGGTRHVGFNPVRVSGQEVAFEPVPFEVIASKGMENPDAVPPRPPVGPEDPPPKPPAPAAPFPVWAVVVLAVAAVAGAAALVLRPRPPRPVDPLEWAGARLAKLEAAPPGAAMVDGVAEVLRGFVERRFAVHATKLTTTELAAAAREQGWPVEQAEAIRALLDECDRAKFAGDVPDDDGCRRLVRRAAEWVNDVGRAAGPR